MLSSLSDSTKLGRGGDLTWFIRIWVGLVVLLNVIGIIGLIIGAPDLAAGWERVQEIYSPWNVWNWGLNMVMISPAIIVMWLRDRRRKRRSADPEPE